MPDNITIPATGTGTATPVVAASDRTGITGLAAFVERTTELGSINIYTTQVNVSNTAATLIAARVTRKRVTIVNRQTTPIFIGPATVTTSNGFQIDPGAGITLYTTALIQAITAAASGASELTHVIEEGDA